MDAPKIYCDGLFRVERICWKILEAFLFLSSNTLTYFQQIVHYTRNWVRICWKWILVLATLGFFKRFLKGASKKVLYITENCTNSLLVFDKYPPKKLCSFLEEKLLIWEYSPPIFLRVIIFMTGKSYHANREILKFKISMHQYDLKYYPAISFKFYSMESL